MAKNSTSPLLTHAVSHLEDQIAAGRWREGFPIDSLSALAREAGVSRATMWKAASILKGRGVLTARQGGRIYRGTPREKSASEPQKYKWQKIRRILEKEIINRTWGPGEPLPSMAELHRRFGICYATGRKVMESLVASGSAVRFGTQYRANSRENKNRYATVIILTDSSKDSADVPSRFYRFATTVERECITEGIRFHTTFVNLRDPACVRHVSREMTRFPTILGTICHIMWNEIPLLQSRLHAILYSVLETRQPFVIFDEVGEYRLPSGLVRHPQVYLLRIGGVTAGEAMGRFLLNRHHTRAAYFSVNYGNDWSIKRYRGIANQFALSGLEEGLTRYVVDNPGTFYDLVFGLCEIPEETIRTLFLPHTTEEEYADLFPRMREVKRRIGPLPSIEPVIEEARRELFFAAELARDRGHSRYLLDYRDRVISVAWEHIQLALASELFDRALNDRSASAWICDKDQIALFALQYCANHRIAVPGEISITGFDNSPVSFGSELTTYDFNMEGCARFIVSLILDRSRIPPSLSSHDREMEGIIVERGSTGNAEG